MGAPLSLSGPCPCGSGLDYGACCGPLHACGPAGFGMAKTAEALMRSRYSAFALGQIDYLLATWHPTTRPLSLEPDRKTRWQSLEVLRHEPDGLHSAVVEFKARFTHRGKADHLHETSRFVRENGRWYYVDGVFPA